jgi:ribosomal protein S18 acetylase RimI-like enzyme
VIILELREFTKSDYEAALALWKRCEGIGLSEADTPCAIQGFLERNPGLSFVAVMDAQVVGTTLCGQDGRRGYLYHLAVDPKYRRQGLGKQLTQASLVGLKSLGIQKCHIMVYRNNESGKAFWQRLGWKLRSDIDLLSYDVDIAGESCSC